MNRLLRAGSTTFASLSIRNFRLYYIGQSISLCGTWLQTVALGLLVLRMTGSGTALGIVTAVQYLPILLLGPWGGTMADRLPKRAILLTTQSLCAVLSLTTALLVATDTVQMWMIYSVGLLLGLVKVFDTPTRQSFVMEMVGPSALTNAISLNSTAAHLARVIGPLIAATLVATVGLTACFFVDAFSYCAVVIMLLMMRTAELQPAPPARREPGQVVAGIRYAFGNPPIKLALTMMTIIGLFTFEFPVVLPLIAEFTFQAGANGYAALMAAMGFGAVLGGLLNAGRATTSPQMMTRSALLLGVSVSIAAIAPTMTLATLAMAPVGFFSITFSAQGNATVQTFSAAQMRGRVMALWSVAVIGTTPIGGPIVGLVGEYIGPRWALALGGLAALTAALFGMLRAREAAGKTADR